MGVITETEALAIIRATKELQTRKTAKRDADQAMRDLFYKLAYDETPPGDDTEAYRRKVAGELGLAAYRKYSGVKEPVGDPGEVRYAAYHESEAGYATKAGAQAWIDRNTTENDGVWRLVEVRELSK